MARGEPVLIALGVLFALIVVLWLSVGYCWQRIAAITEALELLTQALDAHNKLFGIVTSLDRHNWEAFLRWRQQTTADVKELQHRSGIE